MSTGGLTGGRHTSANFGFCIKTLQRFINGEIESVAEESTYDAAVRESVERGDLALMLQSHAFQVDQHVGEALEQTNNGPRPLRLPFRACFIDGNFLHEPTNITFRGILVYENADPNADGLCESIMFHAFGEEPPRPGDGKRPITSVRGNFLKDFGEMPTEGDGEFDWDFEDVRGFLIRVIANWYDLVNDPEVVIARVGKSPSAAARHMREHGTPPPLEIRRIVLKGELKRVVEAFRIQKGSRRYSHRFYVKGHWREFRAERYKTMRGKRVWVMPYIKGRGILIRKTYSVEPDDPKKKLEASGAGGAYE